MAVWLRASRVNASIGISGSSPFGYPAVILVPPPASGSWTNAPGVAWLCGEPERIPGSCSGSIRNAWIILGDSPALYQASEAVCHGRVSGPGSVDMNLTLYKLERIIAS